LRRFGTFARVRKEVIHVLQEGKRFLADEAGAEVVEYILVTLIVLAFTILGFIAFGTKLKDLLAQLLALLGQIPGVAQ
jgi:Flp pilus assembly pilin Flp